MTPTPPDGERPDEELSGVADDGLVRALPDTLASKIAAGEVVQRPANALKELIENSLDAGASSVEVTLQRAGSELIQVVDDGAGMGPRDAEAAFGRHATSKLRTFEDLERLRTLGFRGEALASIASVARVELKTRRQQDAAAVCIRVDGGTLAGSGPCASAVGTCVSVRDLFYNVPARRAFLKSPATEFKHLVETFQALALSHPGVAFSLVHDGTEVYHLAAAPEDLPRRLADLLGSDLDGQLVPLEEATSYLTVRGVVGRPERARRSRTDQYLFVNGRFVKSRSLAHAVASAYGALLSERQFPLSVLFLDVDPRHVDVNVHPTKTEVVFDDDRGIYSFVRAVVKKGLAAGGLGMDLELPPAAPPELRAEATAWPDAPRPTLPPPVLPPPVLPPSALPSGSGPPLPAPGRSAPPDYAPGDGATVRPNVPSRSTPPQPAGGYGGAEAGSAGSAHARPSAVDTDDGPLDVGRALWQLHGRYLLSPVRTGLLVIDQQAAHERILYERALDAMASGMAPSQQLLFPFTVELSASDHALLAEIAPDLAGLGFDLQIPRNGGPILVRGVPADVRLGDERDVLDDLLAQYRRNAGQMQLGARENIARSLARRTSVKGGQTLSPDEARTLVDQLFACQDPFSDPSGRPTTIRLPVDEIERRFRR